MDIQEYLYCNEYKYNTNKTWKRGRKPATEEQKQESRECQKIRVRISNIVARDNTIDKKCCLCGRKDSAILYNKDKPNMITFLCAECRKDKKNKELAEQYRFDIEKYKQQQIKNRENNSYLDTRKFEKQEVKKLVENFVKKSNTLNFGEYCKKNNISRFQFNKITKLYGEYFPDKANMVIKVKEKSKAIQRYRLSIDVNYRKLQEIRITYNKKE